MDFDHVTLAYDDDAQRLFNEWLQAEAAPMPESADLDERVRAIGNGEEPHIPACVTGSSIPLLTPFSPSDTLLEHENHTPIGTSLSLPPKDVLFDDILMSSHNSDDHVNVLGYHEEPVSCSDLGCKSTAQFLSYHSTLPHFRCQECQHFVSVQSDVDGHAHETNHAAYKCSEDHCDSTFGQKRDLDRHKKKYDDQAPRHSCPHCKKYRGVNGFKRKDHLTQHLRNYHHIDVEERENEVLGVSKCYRSCTHEGCPKFRTGMERYWNPAFTKRRELTAHMRKVHNESPFPCAFPDCSRVDGKGFFRKVDLVKHQRKEHAETLVPQVGIRK